ncbi:MAG TPA: hypothetical protein VF759_05260 [Allosphingosinicella sp.]|jgi:hypothetical protein
MELTPKLFGLVHYLDSMDEEDVEFLEEVQERASTRFAIDVLDDGGVFVHNSGEWSPYRLISLIELLEAELIGGRPAGGHRLVECRVMTKLTRDVWRTIFNVIDSVQGTAHHYRLPDEALKLVFLNCPGDAPEPS